MSTHAAVVTVAPRAPLEIHQVPTITPTTNEVLVKVEWTSSTPLDLHQNDGGLLVKHPQVLGGSLAGTVIQLGPDVKSLKIGDKVFGFAWRTNLEKAHQVLATIPEFLLGKIPHNITPQSAVTTCNNFVTIYHAFTVDLFLPLPWPIPTSYAPPNPSVPVLIWGGSSSTGQYALQILRLYGYTNILATSSPTHHSLLKSLGAKQCFDYRSPTVVSDIQAVVEGNEVLVLDCIGSKNGSLLPISKIVKKGTVAVLLPVILKDASEAEAPIYTLDEQTSGVEWEEGVVLRGVRTHSYLDNEFFKEKLQSEIMPTLLEKGLVKPNNYRIIEGKTLLERAQGAMDALRRKEASGERLVWRVSE